MSRNKAKKSFLYFNKTANCKRQKRLANALQHGNYDLEYELSLK